LLRGVGGKELSASPFSWVQRRFQGGLEDSLVRKYVELKQQAGETASRPINDEEKELLARAPLMVFVLVAAADGKVDKKELAGFQGILNTDLENAPPLLRDILSETLQKLERFLHEFKDRNPFEDLVRTASVVDAHYPEEGELFKRFLVRVGIKIASSSGGFLGLGSKISKEEKTAIAVIAAALGLIGDEARAGEVENPGGPGVGEKFPVHKDVSQIATISEQHKEFVDGEFQFAFQTVRDNCFHGFAASLENGQRQKFLLGVDSEQQFAYAKGVAAQVPAGVTCFIVICDATLSGPNGSQDVLLARVSERGRPEGILMAQKYTPRSALTKPKLVGEPSIIGECENYLA
jgi:tellurite resistance protein